jgi:hypothetical protein
LLPVMAGCVGVAAVLFVLVERFSLRVPKWLHKAGNRNRRDMKPGF